MSERLRLRYLIPALLLAAVISAGPIVGLLGTTQGARLIFVSVLGILTCFLYRARSWRKQVGVSLIVLAFELAFLVVLYFQNRFPLRGILIDALGKAYAGIVWQASLGVAGAFLIAGVGILLWGQRAHKSDPQPQSKLF